MFLTSYYFNFANFTEGLLLKIKLPTPHNPTENFWFSLFYTKILNYLPAYAVIFLVHNFQLTNEDERCENCNNNECTDCLVKELRKENWPNNPEFLTLKIAYEKKIIQTLFLYCTL